MIVNGIVSNVFLSNCTFHRIFSSSNFPFNVGKVSKVVTYLFTDYVLSNQLLYICFLDEKITCIRWKGVTCCCHYHLLNMFAKAISIQCRKLL